MKNLEMLALVAKGLGPLKDSVVFVGGAIIELYVKDAAAPKIRATDDVDCVVQIITRPAYYELEEKLRALDFKQPLGKKAPMCRWEYRGIPVDVMPTEGKILNFTNRWYTEGYRHAEKALLPDGQGPNGTTGQNGPARFSTRILKPGISERAGIGFSSRAVSTAHTPFLIDAHYTGFGTMF